MDTGREERKNAMSHDFLKLILAIGGSVLVVAMVGSMVFAWANGELERLARDHTEKSHRNEGGK